MFSSNLDVSRTNASAVSSEQRGSGGSETTGLAEEDSAAEEMSVWNCSNSSPAPQMEYSEVGCVG
jgi:hypothetical protein